MDAPTPTIGSYRLLEPLGRGGMGVVYRAVHQDGRLVALKTVHLAAESQLSSLRREIHALARLRHPGIVRIVEEGVSDGLPWYAMELLEGLTLKRYAEGLGLGAASARGQRGEGAAPGGVEEARPEWWTRTLDGSGTLHPLPDQIPRAPASEADAAVGLHAGSDAPAGSGRAPSRKLVHLLSVVRRLCGSLAYLHGEGLVHRDLKPDNVLVRPDGMPVLVDFGLAAPFGGEVSREALAAAAFAAGTVGTMAPEQIRGELVDARADLYALGCILYELLTGRPPFVGKLSVEVLWQHLHAEPESPSRLVQEMPMLLEELILRLLAKDPCERLGHADDVAAALARLGAEDGPGLAGLEDWPKPRAYLYRPGFTGREDALAELERHLKGLEQGRPALVFIGGESGIGKTRLLLELARRAETRQLRVLSGESVPVDAVAEGSAARSSGALQPLRKALQAIADRCRENGVEQTDRLLGRRGKVLCVYEPALLGLPGQQRYPEPVELPAEAARVRLFSDLAETLRALSEERPLLLVLDDLQWADELTLGFLGFLARAASTGAQPPARLLVLGTYRTEEVGEGLRALLVLAGSQKLRLGRLEEEAVGRMVCDMLALPESPSVFARYLSRHSEGNPFFVAEYLRTAVDQGLLYRDEEGHWQVAGPMQEEAGEELYEALPLPRALKALVARRLDGLPAPARSLTEASAVLGREVPILLLEPIAGLSEAELQEGLDELLRRQVIEVGSPAGLRFVHDKIREVAYEKLQDERRRALHQATAEAMESRASASLAELGEHWERAQRPEKARCCYLDAARQAASRYAHTEAERLYRAYLALATQPTTESLEARYELVQKVLQKQGRTLEAIEQHQQALVEARRLGALAAEGRNLWRLGVLRHGVGQMHEAQALCNQALAIARELGSRSDEAYVLQSLGFFHHEQGHLEEAATLYEQALSIFRDLGTRWGEGESLMHLAVLQQHQGRLAEARELYEQALAIHREMGNRFAEGRVLGNLATVYQVEGSRDRAGELFGQALAIHREVGNRRSEGIMLGNLAIIHREQGRMEEAWALLQQALAIHREAGNASFEGITLREIATFERLCRGALDEAEGLVQEAEAILERIGSPRELIACLCECGHVALANNRPAHGLVERARSLNATLEAEAGGDIGQAVSKLQRAVEAFEAGQHERLFRGEPIEDLPEGLRRWLVQTWQLPPELAMLPASGNPGSEPSG
jgi:predicted ATPase